MIYTQDARRFATWLQQEHPGLKAAEITSTDARTYRDHLLAKRYAPTTINRTLISLRQKPQLGELSITVEKLGLTSKQRFHP